MIWLLHFLIISSSAFATGSGCEQDPVTENSVEINLCNPNSSCPCENDLKKKLDYKITPPFQKESSAYLCEKFPRTLQRVTKAVEPRELSRQEKCPPENSQTARAPNPLGAWLAEHLDRFPKKCGYNLKVRISVLNQTLNELKPPDLVPKCRESMCTSASYMAFVSVLHHLKNMGNIDENQFNQLVGLDKLAWRYFNDMARPDQLMTDFNLGEGRAIASDQIGTCAQKNWPRQGDFVQFWRRDGYGHSVVFDGYLYDDHKQLKGFCYWSSNESTKGYSKRCEETQNVTKMLAGRILK